jgi:hypothetical protein
MDRTKLLNVLLAPKPPYCESATAIGGKPPGFTDAFWPDSRVDLRQF